MKQVENTNSADDHYFQKFQWENFYKTIYRESFIKPYIPKQVGEVKLVRIIGEGSLGSVYLALNQLDQIKEDVVVKHMPILRFNNLQQKEKEASIAQI